MGAAYDGAVSLNVNQINREQLQKEVAFEAEASFLPILFA